MKVILDVSSVAQPLSGIGRYSLELARNLTQQSSVEELLYLRGGEIQQEFDTAIDSIPSVGDVPTYRKVLKKLIPSNAILDVYRRFNTELLARRLAGYQDYIYHSTNFYLPPVSGKSIVTLHDLSVFHFPQFHPKDRVNFLRDRIAQSVEKANLLVTDSEYVRSELMDLFAVDSDRIHAVPLGVDSRFAPAEATLVNRRLHRYGLTSGEYVLSVGTIEPRKNLKNMVLAYMELDEQLRRKCPLVIAGGYGWNSEDLMAYLEPLRNSGEVIYLDYVPESDLPSLYAGAQVFFYLSLYEGFGLPVLESMRSGVPVICADNSALTEVCGDSALLVDAGDVPQISAAMHRAMNDASWRIRAGSSGLERSWMYSWENTAAQMADLYSLLAS